jgi:hypothetical protein
MPTREQVMERLKELGLVKGRHIEVSDHCVRCLMHNGDSVLCWNNEEPSRETCHFAETKQCEVRRCVPFQPCLACKEVFE